MGDRRQLVHRRPAYRAAKGSACLPFVASLCAAAVAQNPLWVLERRSSQPYGDGFALAVAWGGDIDRDGHADIAVGVPGKATVEIFSGRSGALFSVLRGPALAYGFGSAIATLGDITGDGLPDFLVSAAYDANAGFRAGAAYVMSGKDGSVLYRYLGQAREDYFGWSVAALGDVDRDGVPDFAAGTSQSSATYKGYVRLYSGRLGTLIRELRAPVASEGWGDRMAGLGDVDRDGYPDLVVGAVGAAHNGTDSGSVYLYSGRDGQLLRRFDGTGPWELFGYSVAAVGDVNRDGHADFVVGAQHDPSMISQYCGYAKVISGADGSTLQYWKSRRCVPPVMDGFGISVASAGDIDGDGHPDIMVGAPGTGSAYVYSGRDGAELMRLDREQNSTGAFGSSLGGGMDANGDGWPDLVVGEPCGNLPPFAAYAWIIAGHLAGLRADKLSLSLSQSESLTFQLDARSMNASKFYLLLGSLTGTAPGLQLASIRMPLVLDPYFLLTLAYPNGTMLPRSFFVLDGQGRGQCPLKLVPGLPPSLIGVTLQHSFVVIDPKDGSFDFASNAVATKIVQ